MSKPGDPGRTTAAAARKRIRQLEADPESKKLAKHEDDATITDDVADPKWKKENR